MDLGKVTVFSGSPPDKKRLLSRPASLSCLPGSRRKGAQKLEFFKKVEVKNIIN